MLQSHIALRLEANAGAEDVSHSSALLSKGVDDRGARRSKRGLEHVAENAKHAVEPGILVLAVSPPLDTGHHLGNQDQINDQGRGQQRVLADVEDADGLVATAEDLGIILVQSTLVVSDSRHVLDDDGVVRVLALLVEDRVGSNHVVNYIGLGDLLGAELLVGAQVHAVVVAKMVVAGNRSELDTSVDEEVHESRLHFGLARLEVVTADEGVVLLGQLDGARDEGVLGRAVDERHLVEDTGHGEDSRGGDLLVAGLDGGQKVVSGVIDALEDIGITLSVGSPLNDDLVKAVLRLEVAGKESV